jgi:hypothetical protein
MIFSGLDDSDETSPLTRASPMLPVPMMLIFFSLNMNFNPPLLK